MYMFMFSYTRVKICELESTVCLSEEECSRLREETQGLSAQLQASHQEKSLVVEQGYEGLDRIRSLQEQNKQLNVRFVLIYTYIITCTCSTLINCAVC